MINMIDERLKSLTKYVNKNDRIIDIGCDHALLDIYLVKNNIVDKIIVSDVSRNALMQGIININKYNLSDKIYARCGNGLDVLNSNDDINTIIISGMGSNTIINILNNKYLNKINKLIIQSNKDYYLLRKEINKLGFIIYREEVIIVNNKLYINIVFVRGNKKYNIEEIKYGTKNMLYRELYYNYLLNKYDKILKKVNKEKQNEINIEKDILAKYFDKE